MLVWIINISRSLFPVLNYKIQQKYKLCHVIKFAVGLDVVVEVIYTGKNVTRKILHINLCHG